MPSQEYFCLYLAGHLTENGDYLRPGVEPINVWLMSSAFLIPHCAVQATNFAVEMGGQLFNLSTEVSSKMFYDWYELHTA